jgi:hypothetical protein
MAVPDSEIFQGAKVLYATADVINAANVSLAAAVSPYRLEQGADSIQGRVPGTIRTYRTLYRVVPKDTRRADDNAAGSGETLRTMENCSAHGFDSMGIGVGAGDQAASTREFRIATGNGGSVVNQGSIMAPSSDITARDAIFQYVAKRERGLANDAPNIPLADARRIYANLPAARRRLYARELGMNEFARPEAGDGIEALRAGGNFQGFPMHFAAVVARSGDDYVTLENWAKNAAERAAGDRVDFSNAWYFRMYGPYKSHWFTRDEDQSYYGEHAAEGSIGDREHLMGLRNTNTAKAPVAVEV